MLSSITSRMAEASDPPCKLKRASLHNIPLPALWFPHHRIAFGLNSLPDFHSGKVRACDFVADHEQKLRVLHCAGQIPIRFHFVGNLMVIVKVEFIGAQRRIGRTREQMLLVTNVERRNASFRKFKIIRAINAAFFRPRIGNGDASLSLLPPARGHRPEWTCRNWCPRCRALYPRRSCCRC